jgi:adenosine deaminase CECR1
MKQFRKRLVAFIVGLGIVSGITFGGSLLQTVTGFQLVQSQYGAQFTNIQRNQNQLRAFLQKMPKGGELHTHLSGSIAPERLLELAARSKQYRYFIRVPKQSFTSDDANAYKFVAVPLEKTAPDLDNNATFVPVAKLLNPSTQVERKQLAAYRSSQMIAENEPNPNNVFFNAVFARSDALTGNPEIIRQMLAQTVQNSRHHHLSYVEVMLSPFPNNPVGASKASEYKVLNLTAAREHMSSLLAAVQAANQQLPENERVELRFMLSFRRTSAKLFTQLPIAFELAAANDAVGNAIAGINLVGNEYSEDVQIGQEIAEPSALDDYILTLRRLYPAVRLSIHSGERTKWDWHIRDSILLGAERIGHGVNLEASPQPNAPEVTLMRRHKILIEACPISNYLLLKLPLEKHPFLKWMRMGIPVSLNTDDAGIFGSDITEEFTRAILSHPDITWDEVKQLARNSLEYAFVDDSTKEKLIQNWQSQIAAFEKTM